MVSKSTKFLKAGDIGFTYEKNSFISRLIYYLSRDKSSDPEISHVFLVIDSDFIIEAYWEGITIKSIKKYNSKYIVRYKRNMNFKPEWIELIKLSSGMIPYSFVQLIAIFFKKLFGLHKVGDWNKDSMICSEFILEAYKKFGVHLCPGSEPAETTPLDLWKSKKIYEL